MRLPQNYSKRKVLHHSSPSGHLILLPFCLQSHNQKGTTQYLRPHFTSGFAAIPASKQEKRVDTKKCFQYIVKCPAPSSNKSILDFQQALPLLALKPFYSPSCNPVSIYLSTDAQKGKVALKDMESVVYMQDKTKETQWSCSHLFPFLWAAWILSYRHEDFE